MQKKPVENERLGAILASCSIVMFPTEGGSASVVIDSRGHDGDTPLHVVLWQSNLMAVQLLIDAGAKVNACGDMGETPLHVAVRQQNEGAVVALLRAGADPTLRSEFGQSAKDLADNIGGKIKRVFVAHWRCDLVARKLP